jgi:hypothetical protein
MRKITCNNNSWRGFIAVSVVSIGAIGFLHTAIAGHYPTINSNIDTTEPNHWAWNDVIGWIDFKDDPSAGAVEVKSDRILGFAYSPAVGFIALDCATAPPLTAEFPENVCAKSNFFVSNDSAGNLAGWAWNDYIGWISFCGNASGGSTGTLWACPTSPTYQVTIDSNGYFHGWAWNDVVGWISFNCANIGTCVSVDYKVKTTWAPPPVVFPDGELTSSVFDTCPSGTDCGAAINTIMWRGASPAGAPGNPGDYVKFQIASSDVVGEPWDFKGHDGSSNTYYSNPLGHGVPVKISSTGHDNKRYFRYKVFLFACNGCSPSASPRVDDVIINWSP